MNDLALEKYGKSFDDLGIFHQADIALTVSQDYTIDAMAMEQAGVSVAGPSTPAANLPTRGLSGTVPKGGSKGREPAHGNTLDDRPATLYEKYDRNGVFEKHGITKHVNPEKRYTQRQIDGGTVVATDRGPRTEMARKERNLVETNPGPKNREPWAGRRSED